MTVDIAGMSYEAVIPSPAPRPIHGQQDHPGERGRPSGREPKKEEKHEESNRRADNYLNSLGQVIGTTLHAVV